jgi:ubiquitin C-terminal hydrolase
LIGGLGWRKIKRFIEFPLVNLNVTPYTVKKNKGKNGRSRTKSRSTSPRRRSNSTEVSAGYSEEQHWYHLSSVIIHHGNGNNGHYTCCVKNKTTDSWTHRNDSRVTSKCFE